MPPMGPRYGTGKATPRPKPVAATPKSNPNVAKTGRRVTAGAKRGMGAASASRPRPTAAQPKASPKPAAPAQRSGFQMPTFKAPNLSGFQLDKRLLTGQSNVFKVSGLGKKK